MNEKELEEMIVAMIKSPPPNDKDYVVLARAIIVVVQEWTKLNGDKNGKT